MNGSQSTESDFHKVLGRALVDLEFREHLTSKDAERQTQALESIGITASEEVLSALNDSVDSLETLNAAFGDAVAAT